MYVYIYIFIYIYSLSNIYISVLIPAIFPESQITNYPRKSQNHKITQHPQKMHTIYPRYVVPQNTEYRIHTALYRSI